MQFSDILGQLKAFEMDQRQQMDLLELKNAQLESDNKKLSKELDFQKKMLFDTVRHVKLLEYALKQKERIIHGVHQYMRSNNAGATNDMDKAAAWEKWRNDVGGILNQEPEAFSDEALSLSNLQKQQMQQKMRSSVSSRDRIRNGLKEIMDPNELDTYLNTRENMMNDIFNKKRKKIADEHERQKETEKSLDIAAAQQEESDQRATSDYETAPVAADGATTNHDGEIFSCDTLELDQKLMEKYGNKTAQDLLRRSEYNQKPAISDKFASKKSQRKVQLDKIKKSSRASSSSPGSPALGAGEVDDKSAEISVSQERKGAHPKWKPKVCLRSHVDAVRSISFHPSQELMVTSSEDCTVKLWQIKKLKSSTRRVPIHTYLGHSGAVLTTACSENYLFSAGHDGDIRIYSYPEDGVSHDWKELQNRIIPYQKDFIANAHEDIIWKLTCNEASGMLLSASSDGTVKMWDYNSLSEGGGSLSPKQVLIQSSQVPTSLSFYDASKALVGYASGDVSCFDLEKGKPIWTSHISVQGSSQACYQIESHQQLKLGISCHEDGKLRWLDLRNAGSVAHEVQAHQDAVSCLSIDSSSGMYVATGGHDCRIRCWDIQTRQCLQDLSCHRPKNDEGIHDIQYHPQKQLLASVGADSQIRLFQ